MGVLGIRRKSSFCLFEIPLIVVLQQLKLVDFQELVAEGKQQDKNFWN
jgi:hypothetical protein